MIIWVEEWPAKVMISLIENPYLIQSDTAKWHRSCQRMVPSTFSFSLRNRACVLVVEDPAARRGERQP